MRLTLLKLLATLLLVTIMFIGCTSDKKADETQKDHSSVLAPDDIIGYKMVQTVQRSETTGTGTKIAPGETIEYTYLSSQQVLGAGLHTLPTTDWYYTNSGNKGTVYLYYGDIGESKDELSFTSSYAGTYKSITELYSTGSITTVWGSFVITGAGGSTITSNDEALDNTCNGQGKVTVYLTNSNAIETVSVEIDSVVSGRLTAYVSNSPECGGSNTTYSFTKTLNSGTHYINAYDAEGNYWPTNNFSITDCGCLLYQLK